MTLQTIPDIVGANAAVQFTASQGLKARRLFLTSIGGSARFGGSNVSASRGVSLPTTVEVTISASDADLSDLIDLTAAYAYVPSGATLTITYST